MPLLFTSYARYLQSSTCFQEAVNSTSGDNEQLVLINCNNSSLNREHRFCEAVKVDMLYNGTIPSTLSLITVYIKMLVRSISCTWHSLIWMMYTTPIFLMNKIDKCVGYIYEGGIIKWDNCNVLQNNH
jgi:hypothetical protein